MKMRNFRRRRWLFPLIPIVAIAAFSLVVMLLWNAIIPGLTGWALLTYWKAVGLLILSKILFSGFPGRRGGHCGPSSMGHRGMRAKWMEHKEELRAKWAGMNEEERAKFKGAWSGRCGERHEWKKDQEQQDQ